METQAHMVRRKEHVKKIVEILRGLPWKRALVEAVRVLVAAGLGAGAATLVGCSSLTPSNKMQSMGVYAIGIPGIAIITSSTQQADNAGDDQNEPKQANPVTVSTQLTK